MSVNVPSSGKATAPTPQNSLANGSILAESSAVPTVDRIGEEDEDAATGANPASLLAKNPSLFDSAFLESRGSGGYLDSLPTSIRNRVDGLKGVQAEHAKLETEFQLEILALEKKFAAKYAPLYERRSAIVAGSAEPTEAEMAAGRAADGESTSVTEVDTSDKTSGIPDFWLIALRNHVGISELITEQDKEALHYLIDIKLSYLEKETPGFRLSFYFSPNPFFENSVLEKTYYYQSEVGYGGDLVYEKAEGTVIQWKEEKDLTQRVEIKKQRNKTTNRTRVVRKVVSADSFFNFFQPPQSENDDGALDDAALEELDERLELDYQIGEDLKERLVPRAVDYFSGKALQYDGLDEFDDDDEFDEDDSSENEDEEDIITHSATHPAPGTSQQDPQECKQQ